MDLLPAVAIGGPPHSGKSVLAYALTRELRAAGVEHYVLRACPDGQGDWYEEGNQDTVREIRHKGPYSPELIERLRRDVAGRLLPLIVDVGGRPTREQEAIPAQCTHAIVLTRDGASHQEWLGRAQRLGLTPVADLRSEPHGRSIVTERTPVVRGVVTGLERGKQVQGEAFVELVAAMKRLFDFPAAELRALHLEHAPVENVVELNRLGQTLGLPGPQVTWRPGDLRAVLDYLPAAGPLAVYDRGPNWLYAALALHAAEAQFHQFDARLGWVSPPDLCFGVPAEDAPLQAKLLDRPDHVRLEFTIPARHMDYLEASGLRVPAVPPGTSIVLSGQLPHWLVTALARTYHSAAWIAVYQPALSPKGDKAVVVASGGRPSVGSLVVSAP